MSLRQGSRFPGFTEGLWVGMVAMAGLWIADDVIFKGPKPWWFFVISGAFGGALVLLGQRLDSKKSWRWPIVEKDKGPK